MQRTAIVTGVTGQDGSYLTELLLEKDYKVYGLKRRTSSSSLGSVSHLEKEKDLVIVEGDLDDLPSLQSLCNTAKANEFYNLASQSHVGTSFKQPVYTAHVTGIGVLNCLEAIRNSGLHTKFYQASTSELFGGQYGNNFMTETTPFHPRSPYGVAKCFGYWMTVNYREAYKMFACNGLLFNHESPRRGANFVTRKITRAAVRIKEGVQDCLYMGNLDAKRDWGYAPEYTEMMWLMLQQDEPDDYVVATGETHSVREFIEASFKELDISIEWKGKELKEVGINKESGKEIIKMDPRYYRPTEVEQLLGDPTKAKEKLGWEPKVKYDELVKIMVKADHEALLKELGNN